VCLVNAPEDNFPFNRPLGLTKSQSACSSACEKFIRKAFCRDCSNPPSSRIMCVQKARLKIWGCVSRGRIFNLKEELRPQWDFCSLCVRLAVFTNCCYIRIMYKIHYVQSSTTKISVIWSHCKLNVCAGQDRTKYSSIINLCTLLHTSSKKL
jgi:hypothetical protein